MKTALLLIALIFALSLSACQLPVLTGVAATATPVASSTTAPAATAPPQTADTPAVEPVATTVPTTAGQSTDLPASTIFTTAWDDRSPFATGLVTGQQTVLEQRPGATVYHLNVTLRDDPTTLHLSLINI